MLRKEDNYFTNIYLGRTCHFIHIFNIHMVKEFHLSEDCL